MNDTDNSESSVRTLDEPQRAPGEPREVLGTTELGKVKSQARAEIRRFVERRVGEHENNVYSALKSISNDVERYMNDTGDDYVRRFGEDNPHINITTLEYRMGRARGKRWSDSEKWNIHQWAEALLVHAPAQRLEEVGTLELSAHPERSPAQASAAPHSPPTLLSRARALAESIQPGSLTTVAAALESGWPTTAQAADPLTRARACCALAFERAAAHRDRAFRLFGAFPPAAAEVIELPVASPDKPALHPFDLAAAQACEAVQSDPVWRAAQRLLQEPPSPETEVLRAHCQALCTALAAPLKQLRAERDAFEATLAPPPRSIIAPSATYIGRTPAAHDYENLQTYANAAKRDKEGLSSDAEAFRVASASDHHVELQPVLTRTLGGREFQVLRPLSGPQVLILAYTSDLHVSPNHARTFRFRAPPARTQTPRPARRSRGVEW